MVMAMTFSIDKYTEASLRMRARIDYAGHTAAEVFDIMGDPQRITEWYLLAKQVHMDPEQPADTAAFTVEFTFFGEVAEEILHWDPPHRYVYQARGAQFPIKDYVACIEVAASDPTSGVMTWDIYFDQIEGEHYQRILPVMLPAINEASMQGLAKLIGGTACEVSSYF